MCRCLVFFKKSDLPYKPGLDIIVMFMVAQLYGFTMELTKNCLIMKRKQDDIYLYRLRMEP